MTAVLPDCPACGGTGTVVPPRNFANSVALPTIPCRAGCDHGKVTVAQLAALWQAVHEADGELAGWHSAVSYREHLRAVRP